MSTLVEEPLRTRVRRRWKFPWTQAIAGLVILAGVLVFLYPQVASWFSQREQSRVTELAQARMSEPPNDDAQYRSLQLDLAHQYNEAIASGAMLEANANVSMGDGTSSDETLARGVGYLEGTSLPVGGVGTRSVLTAHRGLPTATLFNDLNKAEIGDTFTISVLDQVLTYEVIETQVIEPDQTESIIADPNRDLVTLVICTLLGINSHRILVTAEWITPTPINDIEAAGQALEIPASPRGH